MDPFISSSYTFFVDAHLLSFFGGSSHDHIAACSGCRRRYGECVCKVCWCWGLIWRCSWGWWFSLQLCLPIQQGDMGMSANESPEAEAFYSATSMPIRFASTANRTDYLTVCVQTISEAPPFTRTRLSLVMSFYSQDLARRIPLMPFFFSRIGQSPIRSPPFCLLWPAPALSSSKLAASTAGM